MKYSAIYGRQSMDKKDSVSIETQITDGIDLCNRKGWDYKIYKDKGYSGKNLNRPDFQKLMDDVKSGLIQRIICYRLDRISRSMADFSNLIVELEQYNVRFYSVTEDFDTSTPIGKAMVNIIMTFAEFERETIINRVTDNYYYRTSLGHWGGGPAPYGYKLVRTTASDGKKYTMLEPDENEAPIVKLMYDWYLEQDGSVYNIINRLNEMGISSRGGSDGKANKVWTSRVIAEILWRPVYAPNNVAIYNYFKNLGANIVNSIEEFDGTKSVNLYGKTNKLAGKHKRCRPINEQYLSVNPHQSIIDSDTYIKVQMKRGIKKIEPGRKGTGKNSPFTGLLKCGECGYSISTVTDQHGYKYYACSTRKNRGKSICDMPLISHKVIDKVIWQNILSHYSSADIIEKVSDLQEGKVSPVYLQRKNSLEMEILKVDEQIDNLVTSLATGSSTLGKYLEEKISKLDARKTELMEEINELHLNEYKNNIDNVDELISIITDLDNIIQRNDFDELKSVAHSLLKQITLFKDKKIAIDYVI